MSDLINRQAAIDVVTKHYRAFDNDLLELIAYEMEHLPSAQPEHSEGLYVDGFNDGYRERMSDEQRWIPCSERLPEKAEGRYWVCTNTGYQCQCRWTDDVYGLGSNGEWAWKIFDIPQYSHVIAWMPLPEPYKGGEQE